MTQPERHAQQYQSASDKLHLPHQFKRLARIACNLKPGATPCVNPALEDIARSADRCR